MSKSKNNAIFLSDSEKIIRKKIMSSFSGGQQTVEEHREKGGNPDVDVACQYLKAFYLSSQETKQLFSEYRKGTLLSGEVKKMLADKVVAELLAFQERVNNVSEKHLERCVLRNQ